MDKVQRLNTEQSFIEDVKELIKIGYNNKKRKDFVTDICKKHNIAQETLYWRIRSIYNKSIKDLHDEYFIPSKEELWEAIKKSNNVTELWENFRTPNKLKVGLFDKYFGKSTFQKCKLLDISVKPKVLRYIPSIKDNLGFIAACKLGDSSFTKRNNKWSMRMEHCIKQDDWVIQKMKLLKLSFSWMICTHKITKRNTSLGYLGTFTSKKYNNFLDISKEDTVKYLTPFGIWVLFLDDGSNYKVNSQRSICFAVQNRTIGENLKMLFETYGFDFRIKNDNCIIIADEYQVKSFLHTFLLPYEYLTPECMKYKLIEDIV